MLLRLKPCLPHSICHFVPRSLPLAPIRRSLSSSSARRYPIFPFKLHDIGEGITEVEVLKWHVKEGDVVGEFDNLLEVQSDKSVYVLTYWRS